MPLELAMHAAARERIMPTRVSFSGENFDIATGATAIILAGLLARGRVLRGWVVSWNAGGAVLLGNIVVNAILASPTIHAFGRAPSEINSFVAYPPYVWLPAVLVVAALVGHILVARRFVADPRTLAALRSSFASPLDSAQSETPFCKQERLPSIPLSLRLPPRRSTHLPLGRYSRAP